MTSQGSYGIDVGNTDYGGVASGLYPTLHEHLHLRAA
jgi:hypothetical protein